MVLYMISYDFLWFLEVGPQFSNDLFFLTINVWPHFERSTGNSNVRTEIRMWALIWLGIWPDLCKLENFCGSWNFRSNVRISGQTFVVKKNGSFERIGGSWSVLSNVRISGQT